MQAEFGADIDADRRIRVHDSTADMRYMILPMRPAGREGMSAEALAGLVTRDSRIGVTEPREGKRGSDVIESDSSARDPVGPFPLAD